MVQRLYDEGRLAPGWSITDATLVYWAMISPGVHESLGSLGMTEEQYVAAMRRLFMHGLLARTSPSSIPPTRLDDSKETRESATDPRDRATIES